MYSALTKSAIKKYFSSTLLKNGLILNSDRSFKGDVLITDDKISQVFDTTNKMSKKIDTPKDCKIIDVNGKYLIPGGIDTHTHMELPFMGEVAIDDFNTGTQAAVSGGTTTIVDFILPGKNQNLKQGYDLWRKKADGKVNCDYALHCIITKWNDEVKKEMEEIVKLGVQSFKVFLAYKNALMMDEADLLHILERTKELGAITLVHAENGNLVYEAQQKILKLGINGPEGHYFSRPETFEALATQQAITVAEFCNSPVYIVHLMSKESARIMASAREKGNVVYGETLVAALGTDGRNMWHKDWDIAGPHVMSPPLNPNPGVKTHLMKQLHVGNIQTVGSDNCTFCLSQKKLGYDDFSKIPNGVNGIEDRLAVLWTKGVKQGYLTPGEFVDVTSANAAKIFNMYPNKGVIQVGADADIVVWNGDDERVLSKKTHHQAVDFNVFEGMIVNGTAEMTFSGGNLVFDHKNGFSNLHKGRYISREPFGYPFERVSSIDNRKNPLNYKVDRSKKPDGTNNDNPVYPENEELRRLRYKVAELTEQLEKSKH